MKHYLLSNPSKMISLFGTLPFFMSFFFIMIALSIVDQFILKPKKKAIYPIYIMDLAVFYLYVYFAFFPLFLIQRVQFFMFVFNGFFALLMLPIFFKIFHRKTFSVNYIDRNKIIETITQELQLSNIPFELISKPNNQTENVILIDKKKKISIKIATIQNLWVNWISFENFQKLITQKQLIDNINANLSNLVNNDTKIDRTNFVQFVLKYSIIAFFLTVLFRFSF